MLIVFEEAEEILKNHGTQIFNLGPKYSYI